MDIFWLWERLSEDSAESCIEIWQPQRGSLSQRATACFSAEKIFPQLSVKVKVKLNLKQSFSTMEIKVARKKLVSLFCHSQCHFLYHCLLSCHCNHSPSCPNKDFFLKKSQQTSHPAFLPATMQNFQISSLNPGKQFT